MPLAKHDMLTAIPSDRADEPLSTSILPWPSGCTGPIPDAQRSYAARKAIAISIAKDIWRRAFPAVCLGEVLVNPAGQRAEPQNGSISPHFRLAACVLLVVASCGGWITNPKSATAAEPIRIGAVLPFSGGVELYGRQAKLGLDLAVKELNAARGILGRPVELIYADDKTDPSAAVDATRKLIQRDGVLAVIGPITSRNLNAMVPAVESLKTPLLYATNYEGGTCSRYMFSFSSVPNQELAPLLPYMNRTFGNTYFLLGADRAWPHQMFDAAEPVIHELGGRIVGKEFTSGQETDFAPLIARVAATRAKVLLFALKGDGLSFIPQADDLGLFKTMTVAFLGLSETDLPMFGGKGQNMFVVAPFVATSDMAPVKAFVARVKEAAGADATVSNYAMTHYNALTAVKAAIEKAGKAEKEAMIDALEGLMIQSPAGPVTIGKNHHASMNLFLAKSEGADLVTVDALGEIAPNPRCR